MSGVSKICSTSQRLQAPPTSIAIGNGYQPRSLGSWEAQSLTLVERLWLLVLDKQVDFLGPGQWHHFNILTVLFLIICLFREDRLVADTSWILFFHSDQD